MDDFIIRLRLGFMLPLRRVFETLKGRHETAQRTKARFDPDTGERQPDVTWQENLTWFSVNGADVAPSELAAALSEALDCDAIVIGESLWYPYCADYVLDDRSILFAVEPEFDPTLDSPKSIDVDYNDQSFTVSAEASITLAEIELMAPLADRLAIALEGLGFDDLPPPAVHAAIVRS